MASIRSDESGTPNGAYSVTRYTLWNNEVLRRRPDSDQCSLQEAIAMAEDLDEGEMLRAVCVSQPGGFAAFGSALVECVYEEHGTRRGSRAGV